MLFGGLRRRHELAAAERGIAQQWRDFSPEEVPGRIGAILYGVMCGSDGGGLEYMCAVEVAALEELPDGIGRMRVPPQEYAVFLHSSGGGPSLAVTWQRILDWLASGEFESAHKPDFEVYRPDLDPTDPAGEIEVWVGVLARRERSARRLGAPGQAG
jgi:AraC family transcriptional regulator